MPAEKIPMTNNPVLLNHIMLISGAKNDAALARLLVVQSPVISKIRARRLSFGPTLIIKTHEVTGIPIADIKAVLYGG